MLCEVLLVVVYVGSIRREVFQKFINEAVQQRQYVRNARRFVWFVINSFLQTFLRVTLRWSGFHIIESVEMIEADSLQARCRSTNSFKALKEAQRQHYELPTGHSLSTN